MIEVARRYDAIAAAYQRWWEPVILPASLRLLDLVAPRVAARSDAVVLDLGAGTGPLARAAAARWPHVRVVAVDPSRGMLDVGRNEAARTLGRSAQRRIRWVTGVADALPLEDGAVDAVVSSFTLQYLRNRTRGLREASRVSRPGAAIAVVTWLEDVWRFAPSRILDELLGELDIERPASMEPGVFRSLPSAAALLRRAGYREVRAVGGLVDHQWTAGALAHCVLEAQDRALFDSLDDRRRDRLARLWRRRIDRLSDADLRFRHGIAYVTGRRTRPR